VNTPSEEEIARLLAEHGPKRPPAYAMLQESESLIRRLREKRASFETIRQILRTREVTVSESTLRNYCHEVLGEPPAALVGNLRTPRFGRVPRRERLRSCVTPPPTEGAPVPPPNAPAEPASPAEVAPAPPGNEVATPIPRSRGPRIAQLKGSATP